MIDPNFILSQLSTQIDQIPVTNQLEEAANTILNPAYKKIITTGIGKAGIAAQYMADLLCTINIPSVYIQPTEAAHGKLGMVNLEDLFVIYSNSGETKEIVNFLEAANKKFEHRLGKSIRCVIITGEPDSPLGRYFLSTTISIGWIRECKEIDPLGLLPTTSFIQMCAVSQIIVSMIMDKTGFNETNYFLNHHAGYTGQKAKDRIK